LGGVTTGPLRPLEGTRVLDFSRLLPGPFCSLLLSDLGADVVKVEEPGLGDYARWYPPIAGETSGAFASLNRNKRSIALQLKSEEGRAIARRLADRADIVLESFRPGVMDRLGLGHETLRATNPRLVYCAISGYGQSGPYRDRAGHDLNYAALSGVLALNGPRDGTPLPLGVQVGDIGGGALYAALSILAALLERQHTGLGRFLDISMTDGAMSFVTLVLGKVAAGATHTTRGQDELAGGLPCYGVYPTKDGRAMALGALEPKFWQRFCEIVERPDLAGEGLLLGAAGDDTRAQLTSIFRSRTQGEWIALFAQHDVCCEPVLEPAELPQHPLHISRRTFETIGGLALLRTPLSPTRTADEPPTRASSTPAPRLGEHTREVLRESGLPDDEIERLRDAGIVDGA
jgi:crotonobetainyl-CoA:carnitine CoA-transferase CaiB-like acyl-CoA transferase